MTRTTTSRAKQRRATRSAPTSAPRRARPATNRHTPPPPPRKKHAKRARARTNRAPHPRIQARRVEVARAAGRRRLRRLLAVVLVLATVAGLAGLVLSPLLDVDRVVVVGAGERAAEVRAAADVERGAPLLLLDTGAVRERVQALDWIRDVDVSRDLPGTIRIDVTTRPPVAFVPRQEGGVAVVDDTGTVIAVLDEAPAGLPELVHEGPPLEVGARVRPAAAARVAAAVGPLAGRVARVVVDGDKAALVLTAGGEVRLGDMEHLPAKVRAADAVLATLAGAPFVYLDVSVPGAPVAA